MVLTIVWYDAAWSTNPDPGPQFHQLTHVATCTTSASADTDRPSTQLSRIGRPAEIPTPLSPPFCLLKHALRSEGAVLTAPQVGFIKPTRLAYLATSSLTRESSSETGS